MRSEIFVHRAVDRAAELTNGEIEEGVDPTQLDNATIGFCDQCLPELALHCDRLKTGVMVIRPLSQRCSWPGAASSKKAAMLPSSE